MVLAAPSGTGKTTIARKLVEESDDFVFSISVTTRGARAGEKDGVDYDFVDEPSFRSMVERGEFAEWAEVHGKLYGTPLRRIQRARERGEHAVLDIDVQGARQIRRSVSDAVLIFLLPPSADILVDRLSGRGTEAWEDVLRRLSNAREELLAVDDFDFAVENDRLGDALEAVRSLVRSGRATEAVVGDPAADVSRLRAGIDEALKGFEEL